MRDWQNMLLRACSTAGPDGPHSRIFLLSGRHERRVNVSAAQQRALNLIAAVKGAGVVDPDGEPRPRLLVVGAGAAGWTAAVAAVHQGFDVTLVDEHEEPLAAQRAAEHRPLHPNLYDWPMTGCFASGAGLAFCNWKPDSAAGVRRQIVGAGLADLEHASAIGRLRFHRQHVVSHVAEVDGRVVCMALDLRVLRGDQAEPATFAQGVPSLPLVRLEADVAFVAIGFLPEERSSLAGPGSGSYWRPMPKRWRAPEEPTWVFGGGDGALNEVLRIALKGRRKQGGVRALGAAAGETRADGSVREIRRNGPQFGDRVRQVEARARNGLDQPTYGLLLRPELDELDGPLSERVREQGKPPITLVVAQPALTSTSFLLNRFLVSRLAVLKRITVQVVESKRAADQLAAQVQGVKYRRAGPPERTEFTRLVVPVMSQIATARALAVGQARTTAGIVEDLLDMTRHAWWRARHHRSKIERVRRPSERQGGLRARLEGLCVTGPLPAAGCTATWPDEVVLDAGERVRDGALAFGRAVHALHGEASWAVAATENGLAISADALAIMCDLPPRSVVFAVARREAGPCWLSEHEGRTWVVLPGEAADASPVAQPSSDDAAWQDEVAEQILRSPSTPNTASVPPTTQAEREREGRGEEEQARRRARGWIWDVPSVESARDATE